MGLFINKNNMLVEAKQEIVKLLRSTKECAVATEENLTFPPQSDLGDLSFPLFSMAKEHGIAPGILAQKLARELQPQGLIEKISSAGPYLNFWLKRDELALQILSLRAERSNLVKRSPRRYAPRDDKICDKRIMMEMISPNNNKPLHLGHLRNAFLGESVSRLLESQGAKIIRACLFNDRGLHIAKAMLGYQYWGNNTTPKSTGTKGDEFVVQWYVLFEQRAKGSAALYVPPSGGQAPALQSDAEELVRKWEAGDKKVIALWKKISGWALEGINQTFKRLGIKFNTIYFESQLWEQGKKIAQQGLKNGLFKKDATGAIIADFTKSGSSASSTEAELPPKVLLRSDGTTIYATSDIALTLEKFKKYKLDRAIWCVGQEQNLYLQQHFAIMKMLGYKWTDKCEHLSYGLVNLPEGRMKTREGTVVEADSLLNEVAELAEKEIKERYANLSEKEIKKRAEIIAQAALRYYLLKVGPKNSVNFDPKASISFTGDTGPYLLYTYARIASILRKAESVNSKLVNPLIRNKTTNQQINKLTNLPITNIEWQLTLEIAKFQEIITQSANNRDPSHLAKYLYDIAQQFSNFYEQSPVLQAEEPTRAFRLALIRAIQSTLKQGLHLLTIETMEEM